MKILFYLALFFLVIFGCLKVNSAYADTVYHYTVRVLRDGTFTVTRYENVRQLNYGPAYLSFTDTDDTNVILPYGGQTVKIEVLHQ